MFPRYGLSSVCQVCATAITIAFLKYSTPFLMFKMQFDQQQRILDLMEQATKPGHPSIPQKISYLSPIWSPLPPLPQIPGDPDAWPVEER